MSTYPDLDLESYFQIVAPTGSPGERTADGMSCPPDVA